MGRVLGAGFGAGGGGFGGGCGTGSSIDATGLATGTGAGAFFEASVAARAPRVMTTAAAAAIPQRGPGEP